MEVFINIFSTLGIAFFGYWACGHTLMVLKYGGPRGSGSEEYQRKVSPYRFWMYVVFWGAFGVVCVFLTLRQLARLWEILALFWRGG